MSAWNFTIAICAAARKRCGSALKSSTMSSRCPLSEKLARTKDPPAPPMKETPVLTPSSRISLGLPVDLVAEIIGVRHLIILEYIIAQVMRRSSVRAP